MRARSSTPRLAQRLGPLQVLACLALLLLADWAYIHLGGDSVFPGAPLDEIAHFLTALLLLQLLPARQRVRFAVPALVASVAIDLDHVPQYLGYHFLTAGASRPYTHSLTTVGVVMALALALPRHRWVPAGVALGLLLHFFRDLAEGNGSAVSLLWPLSDRGYSYQHATYLALMVAVAAAEVCAGLISPRMRAQLPRRARRRPASRASA